MKLHSLPWIFASWLCLAGLSSVVAGVVAAQPAVAQPAARPEAEEEVWTRLDTAGFTIFSQADGDRTAAIAHGLETLRATLSRWMGSLEVASPVPTTVYIFRDDEAFRPYKQAVNGDPSTVAGFFLAHPHGNYVAMNGSPGIDPAQIIYHEYLHHFVRYNLPGVPLWFNEGLAELYGGFAVEDGVAVLGLPQERHLRWLQLEGLLPLEDILAVEPGSETYNEGSRRGSFYAQSWALVHYLMIEGGQRGEQLLDFLARLHGGEELTEAFEEAFQARFSKLEEELERYLARNLAGSGLPVLEVPVADLAVDTRARWQTLERAEVEFRLGDLLIHTAPQLRRQIEDHFQRALALDPRHGGAWAGLGYLAQLGGSLDNARGYFERSLELDPGSAMTHYLLARNGLLDLAQRSPVVDSAANEAALEKILASFRRSLELDEDFPEAWVGLGTAWSYHRRPSKEGLDALERARRFLPRREDVLFNLAVLSARLGEAEKARAVVAGPLAAVASTEVVDKARDAIGRAEILLARQQLEDRDLRSAAETLEGIIQRGEDAQRVGYAEALLEQLFPGLEP